MFQRTIKTTLLVLVASAGTATRAQSTQGTGATATAGPQTNESPAVARAAAMPVALDGYCPVCILDSEKWVKGDPKFSVVLDGKKYLFPGEEQKKTFLKRTTKYTPALSGDCIVCAVDKRVRRPGSVNFAASHNGRLYLFPDDATKTAFMKDPAKYENADLAMAGMCIVCKIDMKQDVPGKEEFGTIYGGVRFLFPSQDQKKKFLSNPQKYLQPQQ